MAKNEGIPKRYLTRSEVCRYLGICMKSLVKLTETEDLKPMKIFSEYRFDIHVIDAWMASQRVKGGAK